MNEGAASARPASSAESPESGLPESGLTSADRRALRDLLAADVERAEEQAVLLQNSFEAIVDAAELVNNDDEHDPEGTTIAFERAQVTSLLKQVRADITALQLALRRVNEASYGLCEDCSQPIGIERLRALPAATRCVHCA